MRQKQVRNISRMAILSSSKLILCLIFFSTTTTTHIQTPDHHLLATFLLSQQRMCMNVKRMLYNHPLRMITSTKNIRKKKLFSIFFLPLRFHFFFFTISAPILWALRSVFQPLFPRLSSFSRTVNPRQASSCYFHPPTPTTITGSTSTRSRMPSRSLSPCQGSRFWSASKQRFCKTRMN